MRRLRYGLFGAIAAIVTLLISYCSTGMDLVLAKPAPLKPPLTLQQDLISQGQALIAEAQTQQEQGNWDAAERAIAQSLNQIRQTPVSHQQQLTLGQALNTQGTLYFRQSQTEAALEAWQQAEKAYLQAGDETRQIGSLINQSQALQSLGFYLRARKTLETVQQRLESQPLEVQLLGLRNLGNLFWRMGELDLSEQVLQQAIALAKAQPQTSDHSTQLSALLLSLGNTYQAQQQTEKALEQYQQAAELSNGETRFQAHLNQFRLLLQLQRPAEAKPLIAQIEQERQALPVSRSTLYGTTHFANALAKLAQSNMDSRPNSLRLNSSRTNSSTTDSTALTLQAAELLSQVSQQAKALPDMRAEAYALGYLGHLYEGSGQGQEARRLTQQALSRAEQANAADISYQWQWQLGRILKAQKDWVGARAAYGTAYETLQSLRSDLVAVQPDLQFSFREQVEPVYRDYVDLLLTPEAPGQDPNPEDLRLARQVIESLQIAELNNFFHTACLQDQVVALEQVDRTGTAVLYPIVLRDRLTLILSLPGQPLRSYSTAVPQSQVNQTLRQLRRNLEKPFTTPESKQLAQQLYRWLIEPIEPELEASQIETLTFVLDGPLRNVPMAALYDGERYLIEKYSIALTPGLQLLAPKPLKIQKERTLVAGLTESRHGFSELIHVEQELTAIQSAVPSEVLLDQTFTRAALAENVQVTDFPVIHLATHGQFSSNVEETFILAWDEPVNVTELSQVLRQRDRSGPIELLVLSACETAAGDDRAALGLAGLAVQAGARSTLASLWSLDDESGARLIETFYQALAEGNVSRAEALRQAQLSLLRDPNYRHPIHWASYVLVGNWL